MKISAAIAQAKKLTGAVVEDAVYVRWLSELDGRIAIELYRADEWAPYDAASDLEKTLIIPFPWDGPVYVHHLEAMTYYTNGEYDRYSNAAAMSEEALIRFRHYMHREHWPLDPSMIGGD